MSNDLRERFALNPNTKGIDTITETARCASNWDRAVRFGIITDDQLIDMFADGTIETRKK